jgi:hypothetical protein
MLSSQRLVAAQKGIGKGCRYERRVCSVYSVWREKGRERRDRDMAPKGRRRRERASRDRLKENYIPF